jgi:hypothetical protein
MPFRVWFCIGEIMSPKHNTKCQVKSAAVWRVLGEYHGSHWHCSRGIWKLGSRPASLMCAKGMWASPFLLGLCSYVWPWWPFQAAGEVRFRVVIDPFWTYSTGKSTGHYQSSMSQPVLFLVCLHFLHMACGHHSSSRVSHRPNGLPLSCPFCLS